MRKQLLATLATLGMLTTAPFVLANPIEIQVNNTMSEGGSESAAVERFAEYLEEQAPGRFEVRPFLAGSLGGENAVLELLNLGQTQLSLTGGNWRQQYAPEYDAITVPFVFTTWDEVDAYMESPSGQALIEKAENQGGLKYFGLQHRGPRHMTANKEIHSPADLEGFRLRLPSGTRDLPRHADRPGRWPRELALLALYPSSMGSAGLPDHDQPCAVSVELGS